LLVQVHHLVDDLGPRGEVGLLQLGVRLGEVGVEPASEIGDGGHTAMVGAAVVA